MRHATLVALLCWTVAVAAVERVVDGDTVRLTARVWLGLAAIETVRLLDVNTPERRGPEAEAAAAATAFTVAWLATHAPLGITLTTCARDAFGRALGRLRSGGRDLSADLLAAGLARPYSRRGGAP